MQEIDENASDLERLNITEYCLGPHVRSSPDKIALIVVDDIGKERSFTFAALFRAVCSLAAGLKSLDLPKGSPVTIRANDPFDLLLLFLSTMAADLVAVPTLSSLTQDELEWIVSNSNSRLLFQLGSNKLAFHLPQSCSQINEERYHMLRSFRAKSMHSTTSLNDPAFIFYTSGSTGKPKGVLHAHHTILGRKPSLRYWLPLQKSDWVMHTDNICWTYSMHSGFLDPLTMGAAAIIFTPSNQSAESEDQIPACLWLDLIQYYQISVLVSSPDIYSRITQLEHSENHSLSSLRLAGSAGSFLSETIQKHWQEKFHIPIYSAFGMSELSTFICVGPEIPIRENRLGKIQPGRKVAILPLEKGVDPVPFHTMGMLAIHKTEPGLMLGYMGQLQRESDKYRGDWFLTQDLVSMDEEGYLIYYGRADNVLKVSGGFRVSPIEIENIMKKYPAILDAACGTLLDSESQTDKLVAYIVTQYPSQELAEKIYQFMSQQLSDYKVPHFFYFVEQLPFNRRGKLMRASLNQLVPSLAISIKEKI